jgi:NAD(P)-dependent dehydrogenase (short-subunit alcohol dehydrogenase family)
VVNDLGGDNEGRGADVGPAQQVAGEITAAGGQATASTANIATWAGAKTAIDQAVSEFGGLDIVVNNAGILRDAFIATMDESQWDAVIAVHLKGHFAMIHHAATYWKARSKAGQQPAASIINTTSMSGTFLANPGQANYGAAKAGIAALTQVAAEELGRYGVRVNAIAPIARTRLTLATPGIT